MWNERILRLWRLPEMTADMMSGVSTVLWGRGDFIPVYSTWKVVLFTVLLFEYNISSPCCSSMNLQASAYKWVMRSASCPTAFDLVPTHSQLGMNHTLFSRHTTGRSQWEASVGSFGITDLDLTDDAVICTEESTTKVLFLVLEVLGEMMTCPGVTDTKI